MTAPASPERLWSFEVGGDERVACSSEADATSHWQHVEDKGRVSPVAEYVRVDVADREREEAERERDRLRKIFDDAGKGEHDVLALIDYYQQVAIDADSRYWSECGQLVADHTWESTGLLARLAVAHEHLALMIRYFEEETAEGDGIREEHAAGYEGAKSALVRCDPGLAGETALIEVAELIERASHVPGLTATLDEARARAQAAEERATKAEAQSDEVLRRYEASRARLIAKAIEVGDSWSGGSDSLAERLRDELGAIDIDDAALEAGR